MSQALLSVEDPIEFLRTVQRVASVLHDRPAIEAKTLAHMEHLLAHAVNPVGPIVAVDVTVDGLGSMDRTAQEHRGWNNVPVYKVALIHQGVFLKTGLDFFKGRMVRAQGGVLTFGPQGLEHLRYGTYDDAPAGLRASAELNFVEVRAGCQVHEVK